MARSSSPAPSSNPAPRRRGRPRLTASERRHPGPRLQLTVTERVFIGGRARVLGQSVSAYVRTAALESWLGPSGNLSALDGLKEGATALAVLARSAVREGGISDAGAVRTRVVSVRDQFSGLAASGDVGDAHGGWRLSLRRQKRAVRQCYGYVRVTAAERAEIGRRAALCGLSVTAYVRWAALGRALAPRAHQGLVRALVSIQGSLGELAGAAADSVLAAELRGTMREVDEKIIEIYPRRQGK